MEKDKIPEFDEKKCLEMLRDRRDLGLRYYRREHRKMQMLDATDNGDLWKAIKAKFPPYQLLPDTNFVSYVKNNILASLYTVAKSAQIIPTSQDDTEICELLNVAMEHEWDKNNVGFVQFEAGERAALLNLGLTQVRWDPENDDIDYTNVDPIHFLRDPFAKDLQHSGWCFIWESYHKSVFMNDPRYKEVFKAKVLKDKFKSDEMPPEYRTRSNVADSADHYVLYVWWIKNPEGGIDEIHTIDNKVLLYRKENIQPNMFPFAELYCNLPGSSLVGTSEPSKIFANNLVYNLMDSIAFTVEYKNQRPPKFVNQQSGLNLAAFAKHGSEADRTFIVNGDASKAVHYHQFPEVGNGLPNMMMTMNNNIKSMSGVDDKYTGRDTGSIITTGGTEEMLNRVTLIDTPKVMNYEKYTRELTELTLRLLLEYAPKRSYILKDEEKSTPTQAVFDTIEINFPEIDSESVFEYAVQISSELPKNKQRVQAWANNMMEKQMQYQQSGTGIDVITPEEWIRCQDVPYREQMLKRMGVQAGLNAYVEAQNVIAEYAAMLARGDLPEDALAEAADGLQAMRGGEMTPYQQEMEAAPPMGAPTASLDAMGAME